MSINLIEQLGEPINRRQAWIDRYQRFISVVATFLFFSDIPDYLHAAPLLPIVPLIWIYILFFLSLPYIHKVKTIPKPLLMWMAIYLLISTLSLMTVSSDEVSFTDYRAKVLSVLFIATMYANYQQKSLEHVKYTILAVVLMTIGNNMIELLNPKIFSELNVGRPAGFYIDPNKTGCALVLGMLFAINTIKKSYRGLFVLIVGIGIMATFSRGAILGWVICVAILIAGRVLSDRRRQIILPAIALIFILITVNPLQTLTDYFKGTNTAGSNYDIVKRLEEFQNPSSKEESAAARQGVATGAWLMFGSHPLWGNGLASTRKWMVADVSTHNMYLYYMADHGILGVAFLPGAILAVVYRNRGEERTIIICFAFFVGLWGLFSHEVLAERYTLSSFALLAAMNTNQKWYLKYANRNSHLVPPLRSKQLMLPPASDKKAISQLTINRNHK